MSRNDSTKEKFPLLFAFPKHTKFLDNEAAAAATMEERIRSVWPFVVRRVLAFSKTLRPRELTNYDPEDVAADLWIRIAEKDHEWTPERGKYITFVGVIVEHEFHAIRDKARTVHGPRNSSCRMKQYKADDENGKGSSRKSKTQSDIIRTRDGTHALTTKPSGRENGSYEGEFTSESMPTINDDDRPDMVAMNREAGRIVMSVVISCLCKLSPNEARVVGAIYGLHGKKAVSMWQFAWDNGISKDEVRRIFTGAKKKIVARMESCHQEAIA